MRRLTKIELACNLTLVSVLLATIVHIIVLTLNLFGVMSFGIPNGFSYIFAYILTLVCLALYILGFFVARLKKMTLPVWLRICFYIAFFLFTNVYYILGLYQTIVGTIILFAYIGFLISIISVSIFYNAQKDDKNRLKSTYKFISLSVLCYGVAFTTFIEFLITLVKVLFFKTDASATLLFDVVGVASMIITHTILTIAYYISLKKNKKFINSCLIKFKKTETVKKSIKTA